MSPDPQLVSASLRTSLTILYHHQKSIFVLAAPGQFTHCYSYLVKKKCWGFYTNLQTKHEPHLSLRLCRNALLHCLTVQNLMPEHNERSEPMLLVYSICHWLIHQNNATTALWHTLICIRYAKKQHELQITELQHFQNNVHLPLSFTVLKFIISKLNVIKNPTKITMVMMGTVCLLTLNNNWNG